MKLEKFLSKYLVSQKKCLPHEEKQVIEKVFSYYLKAEIQSILLIRFDPFCVRIKPFSYFLFFLFRIFYRLCLGLPNCREVEIKRS